jgi:hypothetical protein
MYARAKAIKQEAARTKAQAKREAARQQTTITDSSTTEAA